jgi:hypothetical protein
MKKFTLLLILSFSSFAQLPKNIVDKIEAEKISESKTWHNLMHYKDNLFSGVTSEADELSFFYSKNGKENSKEELIANLEELYNPNLELAADNRAHCRFPARANFFLKKGLIGPKQLSSPCPKFIKFFRQVSAKSISLVFSSYFLENPSTAFGHTFLRLNKDIRKSNEEDENFELLDYAVNYGANATTSNGFLYGFMGLTGGFNGEFATLPYFYKVREYNDFESRDLWSYDLNLTQDEVSMVVAHIWEMGQTLFDYYYFTENCSYFMLALLDVANESWELTDKNPTIVIPVDTVKTIYKVKDFVTRVGYRPSKLNMSKKTISKLKEEDSKYFSQIIESKNSSAVKSLPKIQKARILDAAIDFLDFKYSEEVLKETPESQKWKTDLLVARSETGIVNTQEKTIIPHSERPDKGHDSRRAMVGIGKGKNAGLFQTLSQRFALHDFYDPMLGQNPRATMEMVDVKIRYNNEERLSNDTSKVRLEKLNLVNIVSINPIEKYFSSRSWRLSFGTRMITDSGCNFCQSPNFQFGEGLSFITKNFKTMMFIEAEADVHKELSKNGFRLGAGPEAQIIYTPIQNLNWGIFGEYKWRWPAHLKQTYSYGSRIRYAPTRNFALNLEYSRFTKDWSNEFNLVLYY